MKNVMKIVTKNVMKNVMSIVRKGVISNTKISFLIHKVQKLCDENGEIEWLGHVSESNSILLQFSLHF